jgi:hypothetical protein
MKTQTSTPPVKTRKRYSKQTKPGAAFASRPPKAQSRVTNGPRDPARRHGLPGSGRLGDLGGRQTESWTRMAGGGVNPDWPPPISSAAQTGAPERAGGHASAPSRLMPLNNSREQVPHPECTYIRNRGAGSPSNRRLAMRPITVGTPAWRVGCSGLVISPAAIRWR